MTQSFNDNINKLLKKSKYVIGWSIGYNTHNESWDNGKITSQIDLSLFYDVTLRDYIPSLRRLYCPCVSCMNQLFSKSSNEMKRKYGVIEHAHLAIKNLPQEILSSKINNSYSLEDIVEYIKTSECVITNSYHIAYWSQLLARRVIVLNPFSTKFNFFKENLFLLKKEQFVKISELDEIFSNILPCSEGYINECRKLNYTYFEKLKNNLFEKFRNKYCNDYSMLYYASRLSSWNLNSILYDYSIKSSNMTVEIERLHDNLCSLINSESKHSNNRINSLHDELFKQINDIKQSLNLVCNKLDELKLGYDKLIKSHDI